MADDIEEILVAPVASMISEVGRAVAEAASALTVAQIEGFRNLPKEMIEFGAIPAFFHMQDVEVELKLTVQIERKAEAGAKGFRLFGAPLNAKTRATAALTAEGSSSLKLRFAPAPPPVALEPPEV